MEIRALSSQLQPRRLKVHELKDGVRAAPLLGSPAASFPLDCRCRTISFQPTLCTPTQFSDDLTLAFLHVRIDPHLNYRALQGPLAAFAECHSSFNLRRSSRLTHFPVHPSPRLPMPQHYNSPSPMPDRYLHLRRWFAMLMSVALTAACTLSTIPTATATPAASSTPLPSPTATLVPSLTPAPTETPSATPIPTVEKMKAMVTADLLSCRYGPGPNYLFLYGLRKGANIVLIGRTDGDNWHWVYVEGKNKCWVNTNFVDIQGNWLSLPIVYPGAAKLPVSPYYPPTAVRSVVRKKDQVTVEWLDIPLARRR